MDDWAQFLGEVTWFLAPGQEAIVGDAQEWTRGSVEGLPLLSQLLSTATVTPVSIEGRDYELLAWGRVDHRRGWLSLAPRRTDEGGIHPLHRELLEVNGGIIERFREPRSWWNNQNEVLTESLGTTSLGPIFSDYSWLWEDEGLQVPIEPEEYYAVALEANGNITLVNRSTGRLLVFAPDHAFDGVTPLDGCPPYSLMTIDDAPDLSTWVELCAKAWLSDM